MDDASDLDAARLRLADEQDVVAYQAGKREHLDGEEIIRRDGIPVRAQESPP